MFTSLTKRDLQKWAANSKPGDRIEYAWGENTFMGNNATPEQNPQGFKEALKLSQLARYSLFQRKEGKTTHYIIVRLSERAWKFIERLGK